MSFDDPRPLWLLPLLLALTVVLARGARSDLAPARARLALVLRALTITALTAALAGITWSAHAHTIHVAFLLDRSRSIPPEQERAAHDALRAAQTALPPRDATGHLVVFGRDATTEATLRPSPPLPTRYAASLDRDGTDLAAALQHGLSLLDPHRRARLVLFSDGNATRGDLDAALAHARARSVPVDVVPLTYHLRRELSLESLHLPNDTPPDTPIPIRVTAHATAPTPARLHLWCDGALLQSHRADLEPGPNHIRLDVPPPPPGFARFTAILEPLDPGHDHHLPNNTAYGFVHVRGPDRVLYIHQDGLPTPPPLAALHRMGLHPELRSPFSLPLDLGDYQDVDVVVLDDVPRNLLSRTQLRTLERAVADLGVGLIMLGLHDAFGPGGYADTPLEDALPLTLLPRQPHALLSTALVLVIDRSGSMDGDKIVQARRAALAAPEHLSDLDRFGVVAFRDDAEWISPLTPPSRRRTHAIAALSPAGGTRMLPGLELAAAALRRADAHTKHIVVLTDGQSSHPDLLPFVRDLARDRITVSTIGLGDGAHSQPLQRLADVGGGRAFNVRDPSQLPHIFVRETQRVARSLVVHQRLLPQPAPHSVLLPDTPDLPHLDAYVRTEPKPRAQLDLTTPDGHPLLARWTYGLGKTLAFTSDARPAGSPDLLAWPGFDPLWNHALQWVRPAADPDHTSLTLRTHDRTGHILLDALDPQGDPLDDLHAQARITPPDPDAPPLTLTLQPRGAGRYATELPLPRPGTYRVDLSTTDTHGNHHTTLLGGLIAPSSPELLAVEPDLPTLEHIAHTTGGHLRSLSDLAQGHVDPWDPRDLTPPDAPQPSWPYALSLALALFLLDVANRRVAIDRRALPTTTNTPRPPHTTPLHTDPQTPTTNPNNPPTDPQTPPTATSALPFTQRLLDAKRRARNETDR